MNRKSLVLLVVVSLFGALAVAGAEEPGASRSTFSLWLKGLQRKIAKIIPRETSPMTTTVAGVRGAKEDGKRKLYWKGKAGDDPVTEEELGAFRGCIELADKGDSKAAAQQLEAFMKNHPDSALIPDAKKTLSLLRGGNAPGK